MGYFSDLAIEKEEQAVFFDHSYLSPEMLLQWRIEDLFNRLEELHHGRYNQETVDYRNCRLSRTDIEYALPEHLSNMDDIITAIAIAKYKLQRTFSEDQYEESNVTEKDDILPGQISIWEYVERERIRRSLALCRSIRFKTHCSRNT